MPANPLNFGSAAVTAISNILSNALPVIAVAIFGLVVAIASVLFLLTIFGYRIGLSEKFKERVRRKWQRKAPFEVRRRVTGLKAGAKSPWTDPGLSVFTEIELFDNDLIDGDLDYFENLDTTGKVAPFSDEEFINHAGSVEGHWNYLFPQYKSLDGLLGATNLDDRAKGELYSHAARLVKMKKDALQENLSDWAKQYGSGMASRPAQFVA